MGVKIQNATPPTVMFVFQSKLFPKIPRDCPHKSFHYVFQKLELQSSKVPRFLVTVLTKLISSNLIFLKKDSNLKWENGKLPTSGKWPAVQQNGVKFGTGGCLVTSRWGTFASFRV